MVERCQVVDHSSSLQIQYNLVGVHHHWQVSWVEGKDSALWCHHARFKEEIGHFKPTQNMDIHEVAIPMAK